MKKKMCFYIFKIFSLIPFIFLCMLFSDCRSSEDEWNSSSSKKEVYYPDINTVTDDYYSYDSKTNIYLGWFPQTIKKSSVSVASSPSTGEFSGYYKGGDGNYYKKEKASPYSSNMTFSNGEKIEAGKEYYFKVEPIKWVRLGSSSIFMSEKILTVADFYPYSDILRFFDNKTIYPSNYYFSKIRAFLNSLGYYTRKSKDSEITNSSSYTLESAFSDGKGFVHSAFSADERKKLKLCTVSNNGLSTTDSKEKLAKADVSGTPDSHVSRDYTCNDSNDYVFVLSENEATSAELGFPFYSECGKDNVRSKLVTDYSKALGVCVPNTIDCTDKGYWMLRSPVYSDNDSGIIRYIDERGYADCKGSVTNNYYGIAPCISFKE